jgi:putative ABC transport system permease protein
MGLRTALGAERRRLLRQMLTESLLLSAAGGVGGVLLGLVGVRALSAIQPADLPRAASIVPDHRVLAYVLAITVASGALFGILPAWKRARTSLSDVLRDDSRTGTAGRGSLLASNLMVVLEVALALVLVAGAGLLVRSFLSLREVDPGFGIENRLGVQISLPGTGYPDVESVLAFQERLRERAQALPGVESVAFASQLPHNN